jgi:hypothetical protein
MNKVLTGIILGYVFHDAIDEALEWLITRGKDKPEAPPSEPVSGEEPPPTIEHD